MKTKLSITLLGLFLVAFTASAQVPKIGYTDSEYILRLMPETKQINASFVEYQTQWSNRLKAKESDFEKKLAEYQNGQATMTDIIKK